MKVIEQQCHSKTSANYDPLRRPAAVNEDKRRRPLKLICAPTNQLLNSQMNGEIYTSGWQPGRVREKQDIWKLHFLLLHFRGQKGGRGVF